MHIHVHMHMHMCLCMWVYHVNSRNATEYLRVCCPVSVIINLSLHFSGKKRPVSVSCCVRPKAGVRRHSSMWLL